MAFSGMTQKTQIETKAVFAYVMSTQPSTFPATSPLRFQAQAQSPLSPAVQNQIAPLNASYYVAFWPERSLEGPSMSKTHQPLLNIDFASWRMWMHLCFSANKCRYVCVLDLLVCVHVHMYLGADGQTCFSPVSTGLTGPICFLSEQLWNVKTSEGNSVQCLK